MDITTMTAAALSKELASGRLSSTELVSAELRKIKDNDDDSAFITVAPTRRLKPREKRTDAAPTVRFSHSLTGADILRRQHNDQGD